MEITTSQTSPDAKVVMLDRDEIALWLIEAIHHVAPEGMTNKEALDELSNGDEWRAAADHLLKRLGDKFADAGIEEITAIQ